MLKWLRDENDPPCPWDENTCALAAKGCHLHVLKWLRDENDTPCPWDENTCAFAAKGGHLNVLEWLREENDPPCPWDERTCAFAAKGGHLWLCVILAAFLFLPKGKLFSCPLAASDRTKVDRYWTPKGTGPWPWGREASYTLATESGTCCCYLRKHPCSCSWQGVATGT
jgi:hypothetical protein